MSRIDLAAAISPIVSQAIDDRVFPGAVIELGRANRSNRYLRRGHTHLLGRISTGQRQHNL
jgi:hypothetical protein